MSSNIIVTVEFKNYEIDGPLMDQVIGTSLRAKFRNKPASLRGTVLFCRGYTDDAVKRAAELEEELDIRIMFKVVPQ